MAFLAGQTLVFVFLFFLGFMGVESLVDLIVSFSVIMDSPCMLDSPFDWDVPPPPPPARVDFTEPSPAPLNLPELVVVQPPRCPDPLRSYFRPLDWPDLSQRFSEYESFWRLSRPSLDMPGQSNSKSLSDTDWLISKALDRFGLAFGPLLSLCSSSTDSRNGLIALALAQGSSMLMYALRLSALRSGPLNQEARALLREHAELLHTEIDGPLFGLKFWEKLAKRPTPPPAPVVRGSSSYRSVYKFPRVTFIQGQGVRRDHASVSSAEGGGSSGPPKKFRRISSYTGAPVSNPVSLSSAHSTQFFRNVAPHGPIPVQLGSSDERPDHTELGPRGVARVSTTTTSIKNSTIPDTCLGSKSFRPTAQILTGSGDNLPLSEPQVCGGLVRCAQTRFLMENHHRPITTEPVLEPSSIQDGTARRRPGASRPGRLHDQTRSTTSLLQRANLRGSLGIPGLHVGRGPVEFHPPLLRPFPGPSHIHQADETCGSVHEVARGKDSSLPGRFLAVPSKSVRMLPVRDSSHVAPDRSGFQDQYQQEHSGSNQNHRFSRDEFRFPQHDHLPSPVETSEFTTADRANQPSDQGFAQSLELNSRETNSYSSSLSPLSHLLPLNSEMADLQDPPRICTINHSGRSMPSGTGGTPFVVGTAIGSKTVEDTLRLRETSDHGVGCFPGGMGGPSGISCSSRALGQHREPVAHKRSRTSGHLQGVVQVPTSDSRSSSSDQGGQCHQSGIYQAERRNWVPSTNQSNQESLGTSPIEPSLSGDGIFTGGTKCDSRSSLSPIHRELSPDRGLASKPGMVLRSQQQIRPSQEGSVCLPLELPVGQLRDLDRKSLGDERVPSEMGRRGLRLPSLQPGVESVEEVQAGQVPPASCSSSLGSTTLVSDSSEDVKRSGVPSSLQPVSAPRQTGKSSSTRSLPSSDGLANFRNHLKELGVTDQVIESVVRSWAPSTLVRYQACYKQWFLFCSQKDLDPYPLVPNVNDVASFLVEKAGHLSYNAVGAFRSALSAWLPEVEGRKVGDHDLISRVLRSAYKANPPRPRYESTWDVDKVLSSLDFPNKDLPLVELSSKTFTLLAITTMGRGADLRSLSCKDRILILDEAGKPISLELQRLRLPKSQSKGPLVGVKMSPVPDRNNICPISNVLEYMRRTDHLRPVSSSELFITSTKPYNPISSATGSRWLLKRMKEAGIDTEVFRAHSSCGAAASKRVQKGATITEVLNSGRWASESTLRSFYLRKVSY